MEEISENAISKTFASRDIIRYSAPELAEASNVPPTTHSDIYSFAMLILQCITEKVPFFHLSCDTAVIHARFVKNQLPPRPGGWDSESNISDELWYLMESCWSARPDHRPTMEHVHGFFMNHVYL